jgi:hypothetical protein
MPYYVIRTSPTTSPTPAPNRHVVSEADTLKDARAKANALVCAEGDTIEVVRVHDSFVAKRGPVVLCRQAVADEPEVVATEPAPSAEPAVAS